MYFIVFVLVLLSLDLQTAVGSCVSGDDDGDCDDEDEGGFSDCDDCGDNGGGIGGDGDGNCDQWCSFCLTCSYPELTEDHVLTSVYVKIFRIVMRNAVNKSF